MRIFNLPLVIICLIISLPVYSQGFNEIIIDQTNFRTQMNDPDIIILHAGGTEGYAKGHIPGALFIGSRDYTSTSDDSLYWQLPDPEKFKSALAARGINKKSKVIICSDWQSFAPAFRLYFTFDYYGLAKNVRILDGGIKGWAANELSVSTDSVVATAKSGEDLKFNENKKLVVYKDWVKDNIGNNKVTIIDARTSEYYSGEKDGDGHYKRPGHIAGAKNITWRDLVDENHFLLDETTLRNRYEGQGITKNQSVVSYCHVGLRASVIYTIGKGLGYSTRLYDGSYNEWDRLGDDYGYEQSRK